MVNVARGGTDDESNLQSLCVPCHKKKTQQESRQGGLKVPSPSPLDTAPHLIYKKISLSEKVKAKS
ncbi:hypothetical protein HN294_21340 [Acinetobacter baumannii]|nr:hypothetical protein [Acinetobacter baumannii]